MAPPAAGDEVAAAYRVFLQQLLEVLGQERPKRTRSPAPTAEYGLVGGLAALLVDAADQGGA